MSAKASDKRDVAFRRALGGALEAGGMSKVQLAERVNVARPTIHSWCRQPNIMTLGHLRILVRELHFTDEEILRIVR